MRWVRRGVVGRAEWGWEREREGRGKRVRERDVQASGGVALLARSIPFLFRPPSVLPLSIMSLPGPGRTPAAAAAGPGLSATARRLLRPAQMDFE